MLTVKFDLIWSGRAAYSDVAFVEVDLTQCDVGRSRETVELLFVAQPDRLSKVSLCILQTTLEEGLEATHVCSSCAETVTTLKRLET